MEEGNQSDGIAKNAKRKWRWEKHESRRAEADLETAEQRKHQHGYVVLQVRYSFPRALAFLLS